MDDVIGFSDDTPYHTSDSIDIAVPVTSFDAITKRGGNNPDGSFTLFVDLQ